MLFGAHLTPQATAAAIAQHHPLAVVTLPGLSELDQGDLEGLPAAEIRTHPSGVHQHWQAGNFGFVIPGGEHTAGRSTGPVAYAMRRQYAFFLKALRGEE